MLEVIEKENIEVLSRKFKKEIIKKIKVILNNINENTSSIVYKKKYSTKDGQIMVICLYFECFGQKINKKMLNIKQCIKVAKKMDFTKEESFYNEFVEIDIIEDNPIQIIETNTL